MSAAVARAGDLLVLCSPLLVLLAGAWLRRPARVRTVGVVDRRSYREAIRRANRMYAVGERQLAHAHLVNARTWLRFELAGRPGRWRASWLQHELDRVSDRIAQLEAPALAHWLR